MATYQVRRLQVFLDIENTHMIDIARRMGISEACMSLHNGVVCYLCRMRVTWEVLDKISRMPRRVYNYRVLCDTCIKTVHAKKRWRKKTSPSFFNKSVPRALGPTIVVEDDMFFEYERE